MAPRYIDLSQPFEDGMPGFRFRAGDGTMDEYTARIRPFMTHEQSRPLYDGQSEFEVSEISFQTSIGTYLDSPYHRYRERRDIGRLRLDEVILPGAVIDVRDTPPGETVQPDALPDLSGLAGRAVLFNFGWSRHWGADEYFDYPFLGEPVVHALAGAGVKLVGVDTLNIDDATDPVRPAHSILLRQDILIVENLTSLDALYGVDFTLFAVPWNARGVAALPVRAFAMVSG